MKVYKKTITMKNNKKRTYYYKKDTNGLQTRINAETYKAYVNSKKRGGQIAIPNPGDPLYDTTLMADNSGVELCFVDNNRFRAMYEEKTDDTDVNFYRKGFKLTEKVKTINGNPINEVCITNKKAIEQTLDDKNTYCSIFKKEKREECKDALNNAFIISQQNTNKRVLEFNNSCFSVKQLEALTSTEIGKQYSNTVGKNRAKYFMHPIENNKENKDLICLKPEYTYKEYNDGWWITSINNQNKLEQLCNIFPGLTVRTCKKEIVVNKNRHQNPPKTTT